MHKLLLVDDEIDILESAKRHFERSGYVVHTASDGKIALELVAKIRPDLIVTDVTMPNMNGFELCKVLKADAKTKNIPIIVLTAYPKTEDSLMFCGVQDFLVKPFDLQSLQKAVERNLQKLDAAGKTKVLIYAEQAENAELILKICQKDSLLEASVVKTPEEIIQKALSLEPNIILQDLFLYDPPVHEIIKALRSFSKLKKTKILTYYMPDLNWQGNTTYHLKVSELGVTSQACKEAGSNAYLGAFAKDTFLQTLLAQALNK